MCELSATAITPYFAAQLFTQIYTLITVQPLDLVILQTIQDNQKPLSHIQLSRLITGNPGFPLLLYTSRFQQSTDRLIKLKYLTQIDLIYRGRPARRWQITAKGKRYLRSINELLTK